MRSNSWRPWALRLIGLLLLVFVLVRLDLGHSLALIGRADPLVLAAATLLIFPMMALKAARWRVLQRLAGITGVSYARSLLAYFSGMYAGLITPGRVGELLRVRYLTNRGAALGPAVSTVVWDRLIDISGLLLMGSLALWPLSGDFRPLYTAVLILSVVFVGGVTFLLVRARGLGEGAGRLVEPLLSRAGRIGDRLRQIVPALLGGLQGLRVPVLLGLFAMTLAGWVVYYLQAWLLARTLGISISLLPLVVSVTTAAIVALLPLSISGLGTRDAALVVLFQRFGKPGEEALALSALILLMMVANAVLGLMATYVLEGGPRAVESLRD